MFEPLHVVTCEKNKRTHMGSLVLFPKDGLPVGEVGNINVRRPSAKAVAYANLFAAAPELLDALRGMQKASEEIAVEFIEHKRATNWGIVNDAYIAASRAIAKAEGH